MQCAGYGAAVHALKSHLSSSRPVRLIAVSTPVRAFSWSETSARPSSDGSVRGAYPNLHLTALAVYLLTLTTSICGVGIVFMLMTDLTWISALLA
ncbi:hypothetical protein DAEQUDRAFT_725494 [Daedalea quercina L-15889]|uniref:Uncharacterized protein n=1 Tax=Daedalea quercina L-15889 TaxID=1314783 RepID=A0A165R308_9APHY|nr:hypothetical protein DAEQUDRAFT_725494 [Daedalea quercina L-15889]